MPIRLRLTLWYSALFIGTLILFGVALYSIARYSLYSDVDRTLQRGAGAAIESWRFVVDQNLTAIEEGSDLRFQSAPVDVLARTDLFLELRLPNGTVIDASRNLGAEPLPLNVLALERVQAGEATLTRATLNNEPIRVYTEPFIFNGRVVGFVQVARSLRELEATLQSLAVFIMTGIGLTFLFTLLVGAWLAERVLEPVDAVTQAALRISRAEDLSRRLPPYQPLDEIGRLIAAFNEMLSRLDEVFRDQQRFVADVSHELRTPLTALQGNIDLLKRGAISDPVAVNESLATIESEVARLNRLVADLLLLARADGGEKTAWQPVELDTLLLDVFRQGRVLATASNASVRLRLGHEDQATVLGDPDRLRQLFLNLVDNAIKYTPEGEVVLSLWKDEEKGEVRVVVQDTGIGIPADALPLLFRRFYRTDKARSRQLGGTGLGLAIVDWIVQAHHGSIEVQSEEGKGSTFTITLPLPTPEEMGRARVPTGTYRALAPAEAATTA
jgi:signal transduction histidine kinase